MSLPKEYYRLEYIQSSGTQYINTGVYPTENHKVVARLFTNETGNKNWFGANGSRETSDSYCFNSMSTTSIEYVFGYMSAWKTQATSGVVGNIFNVEFGKSAIKINGDTIATPSYSSFGTPTKTLTIFVRNGGSAYISGRVYYFKMYDGETLVIDYIPAQRKSDNVIGLYDDVTQTFYTNAGTGTFTAGPILPTIRTNIIPSFAGYTDGDGTYTQGTQVNLSAIANQGYRFKHFLLKGYTQLEYIESTGTQYIDSGVKPSSSYNYEMKVYVGGTSSVSIISACGSDGNKNQILIGANKNVNKIWGRVYQDSSINNWIVENIDLSTAFIYKLINYNVYYNDTIVASSIGHSTFNKTEQNLEIFRRQYNGTYLTYFVGKLFYLNVWNDNDVMTRVYIPVIRHSDGQVGLLDLCQMKFYGNSGSGSFIPGGVV